MGASNEKTSLFDRIFRNNRDKGITNCDEIEQHPNSTTLNQQQGQQREEQRRQMNAAIASTAIELVLYGIGSYLLSTYLSRRMNGYRDPLSKPDDLSAKKRLSRILDDRDKNGQDDGGEENNSSNDDGGDEDDKINEDQRREALKDMEFDQYETSILRDVVDPSKISTLLRDVGGIDEMRAELWDLVVLPLLRPELFVSKSGLVSPPRGILLYGAPGTGKTMLARALAKEGRATFVNVRLSAIMDKYFGESNKLVTATFSLARKLAPSVIFIDEIDTFLNQRDSFEGSCPTSSMKSEFLTLWDGMTTEGSASAPVTVLGATNRPYDVDTAILRRLPRTFEIGLPDLKSRTQILDLILENQDMTAGARSKLPLLAESTVGYSGSDLKELCKAAAMEPVRETAAMSSSSYDASSSKKKLKMNGTMSRKNVSLKVRPVDVCDFTVALKKVKRTGEAANNFRVKGELAKESTESIGRIEDSISDSLMKTLLHNLSSDNNVRVDVGNHSDTKANDDDIPEISTDDKDTDLRCSYD